MVSQEKLLRAAFIAGAITDVLAIVPMIVPSLARLMWRSDEMRTHATALLSMTARQMLFPAASIVAAAILPGTGFSVDSLSVPSRVTKIVDAYPMLSPDGARIVFQSNRSGNMELYTAKPDGSDSRQLTHTIYDEGTPAWSPNGKLILYAAELEGGNEEVFVMDADGTNVRRLTNHPLSDGHPHWFADGSRILFNSARTTPDPAAPWNRQWHEIFSMKPDGTDVRQITHCRSVCTYGVAAPAGDRIAYRKVTDDPGFNWDLTMGQRNSEVFTSNIDGSNEVNVSRSAAFDGWPMWSPDGEWLLFSSNRNGHPLVGELFVVKADGSDLRQISASKESLVQPTWSLDGRTIYAAQYTLDEEAASIVVLQVPALPAK